MKISSRLWWILLISLAGTLFGLVLFFATGAYFAPAYSITVWFLGINVIAQIMLLILSRKNLRSDV